jgi:hypothetical protein
MNRHQEAVRCLKRSLGASLLVSGLLFVPVKGTAQNITMSDGGSTATINPGTGTGNLGMNNWSVLNQNQLAQQWFWYSVNGVAAQPINNIGGMTSSLNGLNDLTLTYANAQLSVSIEYVLSGNGNGSGSADLQEYITVLNTGSQSFNLNFYQYSNFNLLGNNQNQVHIYGSPYISGDPFSGFTGAQQSTGGPGGNGLAEVIDAPYANYAEAALLGQTLANLNGPSYYQLNNNTTAGPGDVTWAFQWNTNPLAPGASLNITKDKGLSIQIVPEPTTLAFLALGASALGLAVRRKMF